MSLRENYKDDILDLSENVNRKYNLVTNPDDTVSLEDVTVYSQEGDTFGASDINATNHVVNELDNAVSNIDLRVDSVSGKPQWKERGADTWNPFSGGEITHIARVDGYATPYNITEEGKYLIIAFSFGWHYVGGTSTDVLNAYIYKNSEVVASNSKSIYHASDSTYTDGVTAIYTDDLVIGDVIDGRYTYSRTGGYTGNNGYLEVFKIG